MSATSTSFGKTINLFAIAKSVIGSLQLCHRGFALWYRKGNLDIVVYMKL